MKKKNKRLITVVGLLLVAIVGATFAYYTSNTTFENVFNAGKYKVTLTEVFESPDNWVPGETIPKTVTAKNDGTVPAAVRISYTEQWLKEIDGVETDITSQVSPNPANINFANQGDWTLSNGYYYYKYILEPTDETSSFISGVTLDPNLDSVICTGEGNEKTCEAQNLASGAKYKLTFTIQTVQADKYQSVWDTNTEIAKNVVQTVQTCPGCVFAKNFEWQGYGALEVPTTNTIEPYSDIFVGYTQEYDEYEEKDVIKGVYACAKIENNNAICLEGWNHFYDLNKEILDGSNFDTCNYNNGEYKCSKGTISFTIYDYVGDVYVSNGNESCVLDRDGQVGCYYND